ncbi:MAG TPA: hypothetical protein VFZ76_14420, partial [Anaerolineales bacterium]
PDFGQHGFDRLNHRKMGSTTGFRAAWFRQAQPPENGLNHRISGNMVSTGSTTGKWAQPPDFGQHGFDRLNHRKMGSTTGKWAQPPGFDWTFGGLRTGSAQVNSDKIKPASERVQKSVSICVNLWLMSALAR